MKVEWTIRAEQALDEAAAFVYDEFGQEACDRLLHRVHHVARLLEQNPHLGPVEPLLADRGGTYRSVVVRRLNKIVYRVRDNHIIVADFWDTRREPKALASGVE